MVGEAILGVDITVERLLPVAVASAQELAHQAPEGLNSRTVVIGYDRRFLAPELAEVVAVEVTDDAPVFDAVELAVDVAVVENVDDAVEVAVVAVLDAVEDCDVVAVEVSVVLGVVIWQPTNMPEM